jgi:outer membrane receptor for ferrienterochelin and colicin
MVMLCKVKTLPYILFFITTILLTNHAFAYEDKEVITFDDIEKERPATLMELLKKRVGLGDSNGSITLRGIPNVAVYLDGVPVGGAVVWLDRIKPEDVERIEVYRGAASSRFGADAI